MGIVRTGSASPTDRGREGARERSERRTNERASERMVGFIMRDQAVLLLLLLLPGLVDVCAPAPARVHGGWGNRARQDGRRHTTSQGARTRPEPTDHTRWCLEELFAYVDNASRGRDDDDDDGGGLLTAGDKGNYGPLVVVVGLTDWEEGSQPVYYRSGDEGQSSGGPWKMEASSRTHLNIDARLDFHRYGLLISGPGSENGHTLAIRGQAQAAARLARYSNHAVFHGASVFPFLSTLPGTLRLNPARRSHSTIPPCGLVRTERGPERAITWQMA